MTSSTTKFPKSPGADLISTIPIATRLHQPQHSWIVFAKNGPVVSLKNKLHRKKVTKKNEVSGFLTFLLKKILDQLLCNNFSDPTISDSLASWRPSLTQLKICRIHSLVNVVIDGKMMLSPNIYTYMYIYIDIYGYICRYYKNHKPEISC